jgi:hypothetical protein
MLVKLAGLVQSRNPSIRLPHTIDVLDSGAVYVPHEAKDALCFGSIGVFCTALDVPIPDLLHAITLAVGSTTKPQGPERVGPVRRQSGTQAVVKPGAHGYDSEHGTAIGKVHGKGSTGRG